MTNQPQQSCDAQLLDALLRGAVDDDQERQLIDHLNHCDRCRQTIDTQSLEACDETSKLLSKQPYDADSCFELSREEEDRPDESSDYPVSIRSVLDSLAPTDDPTMLGRLGGYEVSGVIGAGGMGVVLKALDRSLDRTIAIKVMAPHLASSGAAKRRFEREAKAAAAVLHPNVVAIHGVSAGEGNASLPYLVMPYVRGSSLQARIDCEGPLTVTEILRIASQIVEGLAAAHSQGLVHRDIKPANILLEESVERVSITDFGLARAVDDATLTHSGVLAGTPQYMSPEQARGEPIDGRSDLFSLGSVIYSMCTGRAPFRADTSYGILRRITDQLPRPIREINPDIPPWLCRLVEKLHAKSPDDRYQSAAGVAEVLQQCLAHVQTPDVSLPKELRHPSRLVVTKRHLAVAGAVVLIAGCLIAAMWQPSPSGGDNDRKPFAVEPPVSPPGVLPQGWEGRTSAQDLQGTDPSKQSASPTDTSWSGTAEPSIESIRILIELLEEETRQSFDLGPEHSR